MFGNQERVSGYEGLSVDMILSKKRLMPFVMIKYESKAPAFANIDDLDEKLQKHYGRVYDKPEEFLKILKQEEDLPLPGVKLTEIKQGDKSFVIHKVCLDDENFHE